MELILSIIIGVVICLILAAWLAGDIAGIPGYQPTVSGRPKGAPPNRGSFAKSLLPKRKCKYCGTQIPYCHKCAVEIHWKIIDYMNLLEHAMIKDNEIIDTDLLKIGSHLRAVWQFRDLVNEYFNNIGKKAAK